MGPSNLSCVLIQRMNSIPALSGGRVVGALNADAESMLYEAAVSVMSRGSDGEEVSFHCLRWPGLPCWYEENELCMCREQILSLQRGWVLLVQSEQTACEGAWEAWLQLHG